MIKRALRKVFRGLGYEVRRIPSRPDYDAILPFEEILLRFHRRRAFRHVLDVGAHTGETAVQYVDLFPDALIHSIEPCGDSYDKLQGAMERHSKVIPYHLALGDETDSASLFVNAASVTNSLLPASQAIAGLLDSDSCDAVGTELVPVMCLDDFCAANAIDAIDLLKIDAQGYEDRILNGAPEYLRPEKTRLVFLEIIFIDHYVGQAGVDTIFSLMNLAGYRLYGFYETRSTPRKGYLWTNALFVPRDEIDIS